MPDVSIIIAIAPYHRAIAARAIESARAQTVPCTVITAYDDTMHGAGYTRNQALKKVTTPYTVFLDADDTINPRFVERCLQVVQPGKYIFTDWYQDAELKAAPDCPWTNGTWHVITTLLPTDAIRRVGGFDENLPGADDTDLYLKLTTSGVCGIHLAEPLFHYGAEGQRAKAIHASGEIDKILRHFTNVYGGKQMGCCGGVDPGPMEPSENGEPGDILVMAAWAGNRQEIGVVSGRLYPRTGNFKQVWVDARDAKARPDLWRPLDAPLQANARPVAQDTFDAPLEVYIPNVREVEGVDQVAAAMMGEEVGLPLAKMQAMQADYAPDVERVLRLAQRG